MRYSNQGRFRSEVRFFQQQFLQDGNLPFSDVLSSELIEQLLTALQVGWIDCIYTPLVTLRVFLGQVLSADHSCRAAVARLIAYRVAGKNARALRKRAPIARPASVCRKHCSRKLRDRWDAGSMPTSNQIGCGRSDAFTSSMARPSRCPILARISMPIHSRRNKNPVSGFR